MDDKALQLSSLRPIILSVSNMIDLNIGTAAKTAADDVAAGIKEYISDGIPVHNIVNPIVEAYFKSLPATGYKQSDVSRMWYYTKYVSESSTDNMADRSNPFIVYTTGGDKLLLESEGLPTLTILPSDNVYECYNLLPNRLYHWTVTKNEVEVKSGDFKTIGFIRLINIPSWPNLRDIAYTPIMKPDMVLSAANPDYVEVGSDDYNFIKSLGIDTLLNFRKPRTGSNTEKPWRSDIFTYGYDISISAYSAAITNPANYKLSIETLISELKQGHKVVFNCFAGADRTGTFRYILQGICGVPKRIAQGYYELTSLMYWLNTKKWDKEESSGGEIRTFDKKLEAAYGPDFYTQCYRLMTEVFKLTDVQIKELQGLLMVDPASAPKPQIKK